MKILIIEDEPAIRETLQDLLEMHGHTVLAAPDGPAGVRLAAQRPDLIFCDVGLPGLDGHQVLDAIHRDPACRDTPFIFLTAQADRNAQRRGMALGADDYITKPFSERDIVDAINARVRRQQPLRQRVTELMGARRSEITANWSHELMTPLNGVLGGLALIEAEAGTIKPAELRELLGLIRVSAERQLALARKLVLHFELEHCKAVPPAPAQCDVPVAILAGSRLAAPGLENRPEIALQCAPGQVPLTHGYLVAAVAEVLDNACRYSPPDRPVTVVGTSAEGRYRIEVTDLGPGLKAEQFDRIGPFVQFDRGRTEQQGLGLGLAIARSVAEIAGGRLELSPGPGGAGLRVVLDLPLS